MLYIVFFNCLFFSFLTISIFVTETDRNDNHFGSLVLALLTSFLWTAFYYLNTH